jgi:hypothetical protein
MSSAAAFGLRGACQRNAHSSGRAGLEASPHQDEWHEVVEEIRRPATALGSGDIAA